MALNKVLSGEPAIHEAGIVPAHAQAFRELCRKQGWFVIFRGVNHDATPLIADNYPTKDMGVHGKSSNWGPQAGFICLNQFFSKVAEKGEEVVRKSNAESALSLAHGYPAVPLVLSEAAIANLVARGKVTRMGAGTLQCEVPREKGAASAIKHAFKLLPVNEETVAQAAAEMAALAFTVEGKLVKNPLTTRDQLLHYLRGVVGTITSMAPPRERPAGTLVIPPKFAHAARHHRPAAHGCGKPVPAAHGCGKPEPAPESSGPGAIPGLSHLYFVRTDPGTAGYPHWYDFDRGKLLLVLASTGRGRYSKCVAVEGTAGWPKPGADDGHPFSLPLTADYDIFTISPPATQILPADTDRLRRDLEGLRERISHHAAMSTVPAARDAHAAEHKDLMKRQARMHWGLAKAYARSIRELQKTQPWGNATGYHVHGILKLNEAAKRAGYRGGFVCHHGIEQENLFYAEVDQVYAVFTPRGDVYAVPPTEIEFFLADIDALGHVFYTNPAYRYVSGGLDAGVAGLGKKMLADGKTVVKQVVSSIAADGTKIEKKVDVIVFHNRRIAAAPDGPPKLQRMPTEKRAATSYKASQLTLQRNATRHRWETLMGEGAHAAHA